MGVGPEGAWPRRIFFQAKCARMRIEVPLKGPLDARIDWVPGRALVFHLVPERPGGEEATIGPARDVPEFLVGGRWSSTWRGARPGRRTAAWSRPSRGG